MEVAFLLIPLLCAFLLYHALSFLTVIFPAVPFFRLSLRPAPFAVITSSFILLSVLYIFFAFIFYIVASASLILLSVLYIFFVLIFYIVVSIVASASLIYPPAPPDMLLLTEKPLQKHYRSIAQALQKHCRSTIAPLRHAVPHGIEY